MRRQLIDYGVLGAFPNSQDNNIPFCLLLAENRSYAIENNHPSDHAHLGKRRQLTQERQRELGLTTPTAISTSTSS